MDIPLLIAILAILAWTLLPQLDRYTESRVNLDAKPSLLGRLAPLESTAEALPKRRIQYSHLHEGAAARTRYLPRTCATSWSTAVCRGIVE